MVKEARNKNEDRSENGRFAASDPSKTAKSNQPVATDLPSFRGSSSKPSPYLRRLRWMVKSAVLLVAREIVWTLHAAFVLLILPLIVRTRRQGELPENPCILCVPHVGELDPYFVIRATGRYRLRALFERDGPEPIARFFLKSMWRFRVSQRPDLKPTLNKKTMRDVVSYLNKGGVLMIFPEGYRHWDKKLYPGAAVIAHRANVPVIPVGIERGHVFRKEFIGHTFQAMKAAIKDYRRLGRVTVHFTEPIHPDDALREREDVNRLMPLIEARFADFYERFYNTSGPVWTQRGDAGPNQC